MYLFSRNAPRPQTYLARRPGVVLATLMVIIGACSPAPSPQAVEGSATAVAELDRLVDSLRLLRGTFSQDSSGVWSFDGRLDAFRAFDPFGDQAVIRLTECLDDLSPSVAVAHGKQVPLGIVCYWALRRIAYVEWNSELESSRGWQGEIDPSSSPEQLRAAKAAWRRAVQQRRYSLL
jgi:hypothetical protein